MARAQRLIAGEQPTDELDGCLAVAEGIVGGTFADHLQGASHYYAPASMVPPGRVPAWVEGATLTAERWGHKFYRSVK